MRESADMYGLCVLASSTCVTSSASPTNENAAFVRKSFSVRTAHQHTITLSCALASPPARTLTASEYSVTDVNTIPLRLVVLVCVSQSFLHVFGCQLTRVP
eukprot:m.511611 g.511611  ORF g.511611 m.511611 type:complete len:101 (-) comp57429_c0_seq1:3671-3973(-)